MTPYLKTPKTNEEIVAILKDRGLTFDAAELLDALARIGYYRLKGYLVPFRQSGDVNFVEGANLSRVMEIYAFDCSLRTILSEGLAKIEVAVRARIIRYHLEINPDPFAYSKQNGLPGLREKAYTELKRHIDDAVAKAKSEPFMKHLAVEHGIVDNPPLWTMMEVLPFGSLVCYLQGLPEEAKRKTANSFNVTPSVLVGFLNALRRTRNVCAHHARLWNRKFGTMASRKIGVSPDVADLDACFVAHNDPDVDNAFVLLSLTRYMVRVIEPTSEWLDTCRALISTASPFILRGMGFPTDWQKLKLWQ